MIILKLNITSHEEYCLGNLRLLRKPLNKYRAILLVLYFPNENLLFNVKHFSLLNEPNTMFWMDNQGKFSITLKQFRFIILCKNTWLDTF